MKKYQSLPVVVVVVVVVVVGSAINRDFNKMYVVCI